MRSETLILLAIYIGFCVVEFWRCGFFNKPLAKKDDGWVEFFSMFNLLIVTQPIILLGDSHWPTNRPKLSRCADWYSFARPVRPIAYFLTT